MADYERRTAAGVADVLRLAEQVLAARLPIEKVAADAHSITLRGRDGTLVVRAHRHGLETVVQASTNQLRTSRLDIEAQYFLNELPYQPEDVPRQPGDTLAGGRARPVASPSLGSASD
ncbi:MAG: hypothetical protein HY703_01365 [Gemmatimonadetes bacterium]|nr:hypothetical protein [Gemmatimonadota bacterium]